MNNTETKKTANQEPKTEKTAFELCGEYEEALIELDTLPDLLEILIRRFNLDHTELTEAERFDLSMGHAEIFSVVSTVQRRLWDMHDKVINIAAYKS